MHARSLPASSGQLEPSEPPAGALGPTCIVVCSLEATGPTRRRLQILVDELIALDPELRVLFVEPAVDVPQRLVRREAVELGHQRLRTVSPQLAVLRPRKWLPRLVGPFADRSLHRQVDRAIRRLGLDEPVLWLNDAGYARWAVATGWAVLYDVTDDWLLTSMPRRVLARLERDEQLLLDRADTVVVCSPELARTKGSRRAVELVPNAVDVTRFRRPRPRPADLPRAPTAVYVGTLHDDRFDVPLLCELASALPSLSVVLVGPSNLRRTSTEQLGRHPNISLLGPRPYDEVPAFLHHADVVVVPHLVNPFTETLDPIKAYECLAAGRPTVATPVAGFRDLGPPVAVADREGFVDAVRRAIGSLPGPGGDDVPTCPPGGSPPDPPTGAVIPTWTDRAREMARLVERTKVSRGGAGRSGEAAVCSPDRTTGPPVAADDQSTRRACARPPGQQ